MDSVQLNFDSESLALLNVVLAIVIFGIALGLRPSDFGRALKKPKAFVVGLVCQFLLLPAASLLLIKLFSPAPEIALGMLLLSACPGGNISNFLTSFANGNTALSMSMSGVSTLFAIAMTPLNLTFWAAQTPATAALLREFNVDGKSLLVTIFLVLLLPLAAGMLTRALRPAIAVRLAGPFRVLSVIVFVAFVGIALWGNRAVIPQYVHLVFLVVLAQNAIAYLIGFLASRTTRLAVADSRAVMLEVGIQNSALGLVIAFDYFPGLGAMALVLAWWGIWHIITGLALASWWRTRTPDVV